MHEKICGKCQKNFSVNRKNQRFCSVDCALIGNSWNVGKKLPESTKKKMGDARRGKKRTIETRLKMSKNHKRGSENHFWRGGVSKVNESIRKSLEYKLWRESVFERDNYTCIWCGTRGGKLNADHIKPFALYPELRFAIDNGRTLCVPCHKTTDTYGWKMKSFSEKTN